MNSHHDTKTGTQSHLVTAHTESAPATPVLAAAASGQDPITPMLTQLDEMAAALGARGAPLSIETRRRLAKLQSGAEVHASTVLQLGDRYGLVIPGVSSAVAEADLQQLKTLESLERRFESMRGLVGDMRAEAQDRIWRSASVTYATLTRLVPQYPSLQRELTPMASFLAVLYKDAPTSLRKKEAKALAKARSTRAAKKGVAAPVATTSVAPAQVAPAVAPPAPVTAPKPASS